MVRIDRCLILFGVFDSDLSGLMMCVIFFFFFSSRRRHTRCSRDWSSDVCSSDLDPAIDPDRLAGLFGARHEFSGGYQLVVVIDQAYEHFEIFLRVAVQIDDRLVRSEERRVGKEGRSMWSTER